MSEKNSESQKSVSRRDLFIGAGATAGVVAAAALLPREKTLAAADLRGTSETVRMHNDLQRALSKPIEQRRWAMVIDTRRCIGCHACTASCMAENNLPAGVTYRTVPEVEEGTYPHVRRFFMPTNCMQCEKPPCMGAANAIIPGSISKRPDGIVQIDYNKMKGGKVFKAAKEACPYAALYYDEGKNHTDGTPAVQPYEQRAVEEYGKKWNRKQTKNSTRKCHFCTQRLAAGQLPACVTTCTGLAMHFGDLSDPESLVSQMVKTGVVRINEKAGSEPRVYFVAEKPEESCMVCHS